MDDFDRRKVFCWHGEGTLLYECQDPEHTTPKATAGRERSSDVVVIYYRGSGEFYVPNTDRSSDMFGASTIHQVGPCEHKHTTPEAAETCGRKMTDRAVREWNKARGIT